MFRREIRKFIDWKSAFWSYITLLFLLLGCIRVYINLLVNLLMSAEIGVSRLCLVDGFKAVIMEEAAPNTYDSSLSFVLSLGEYLCVQAKLYPETVYL